MKIKLDHDFFIEVNQWSYDLKKFCGIKETIDAKKKTIKESPDYKEYGYFGSLEKAVEMYVRILLMDELPNEVDLKTYVQAYGEHVRTLMESIRKEMK